MDSEAYRQEIEGEIVDTIATKLQTGEITFERAQGIARVVLEKLHPPLSLGQIQAILPVLDAEFNELRTVLLPLMQQNEQKMREKVLQHTEQLLQSEKFAEALAVLKSRKDN